jgi:hypothetical protein
MSTCSCAQGAAHELLTPLPLCCRQCCPNTAKRDGPFDPINKREPHSCALPVLQARNCVDTVKHDGFHHPGEERAAPWHEFIFPLCVAGAFALPLHRSMDRVIRLGREKRLTLKVKRGEEYLLLHDGPVPRLRAESFSRVYSPPLFHRQCCLDTLQRTMDLAT